MDTNYAVLIEDNTPCAHTHGAIASSAYWGSFLIMTTFNGKREILPNLKVRKEVKRPVKYGHLLPKGKNLLQKKTCAFEISELYNKLGGCGGVGGAENT